jgi:hypothetical protein
MFGKTFACVDIFDLRHFLYPAVGAIFSILVITRIKDSNFDSEHFHIASLCVLVLELDLMFLVDGFAYNLA